jgi:hypothetical protein
MASRYVVPACPRLKWQKQPDVNFFGTAIKILPDAAGARAAATLP